MIDRSFAARSHVRNAVLCGLLMFGLAACGADESASSGSTPIAAGSTPSLVGPSVGVIGRPGGTAPVTNPAPATGGSKGTTPAAPPVESGPPPVESGPPPVKTSAGSATLDWTAPTENSDGSILTNLAGYIVYYGTSPSNLSQSVKIPNPGLTAYTMTNLASGKWYFAVSAYTSAGVESVQSGIISTTI